ncbi:MAG TPA: glycosyltransferase [Stellaceae bacterium]|jgi:glycosyltransferase involved in cell wall biosynthesis
MAGDPRRIVLLTGNSLCHNPRAMKEATALARAGYQVDVLGAWLDPELKARDERLLKNLPFRFAPVLDAALPGVSAAIDRLRQRAARKAAQLAYDLTGAQNPLQLGLGIGRMLRLALRIPAQLYIAHSEPCLAVARRLLRAGRRVGVDMEDWFSEDLLPEARRHRPLGLLRTLEREVLRRGAYASCPSQVMSATLAATYDCPPPTVVYNAFAWSDRQGCDGVDRDRRERRVPSLHWFSTTLGPGRGLEDLLAALALLDREFEVHLRGNPAPGFAAWIEGRVPERWRGRVRLHPVVTNDELLPRIAEHDIGFAGEEPHCRSRDLTVTNKVLHYLLGGLAVVASDTKGQGEVAARAPGAVLLYPAGDAQALASVLDRLLGSHEALARAKAAALAVARDFFCWERQEPVLLDAIERAVSYPTRVSR